MASFIKWVGGKSQLLSEITPLFPTQIDTYYEPFIGGGSILFWVLESQKNGLINVKNIVASDINEDLIGCYNAIKNDPEKLIKILTHLETTWKSIEAKKVSLPDGITRIKPLEHAPTKSASEDDAKKCSREGYYYWIRDKFNDRKTNTDNIERAAWFIFMNKIGWRGVCRYSNHNNSFNVPYGNPSRTCQIFNREHINSCSELIKDVTFVVSGWKEATVAVKKNDFIFLDPLYIDNDTESTPNFTGYTANGFSEHDELFKFCNKLKTDNISWIMTNAHNKLFFNIFENVTIKIIDARRAINSKNPAASTKEMIIINVV